MSHDSWDLNRFSAALTEQAERREAERKIFSAELDKIGPVLFMADEGGPEGRGTGWFKLPGGFFAFRRMSNGYENRPCMSLEFDLVRKLAEAL